MFDRLIESDTTEFKPRRRYFLVSSVVVGLLFVSAVIFSIYASEIGLGNDAFDVAQILAPTDLARPEPEPPKSQRNITASQTKDTTRMISQRRTDEIPDDYPPVSVTQNKYQSRPYGKYIISDLDRNTDSGSDYDIGPNVGGRPDGTGTAVGTGRESVKGATTEAPPPRIEKPTSKYIGVANGYATYLPKPTYPPPALSMGIEGKVDVQITINENGDVISAKAASGNVLLRQTAEIAARRAKFKPTKLNDVPVKVTGVIVYNFTRN